MNAQNELDVEAELVTAARLLEQDRAQDVLSICERVLAYRPKAFIGRLYYAHALDMLHRRYEATVNLADATFHPG